MTSHGPPMADGALPDPSGQVVERPARDAEGDSRGEE